MFLVSYKYTWFWSKKQTFFSETMNKWILILIVWPSWVWKWTMISLLKERRKDFFYPISATTRAPRKWERNWETYYFISEDEFRQKITAWDFIEYAKVHKKWYYWLLKAPVLDAIDKWKVVIREIDVQWLDSVKTVMNWENFKSIFILPPSKEHLIWRIVSRDAISEDELLKRLDSLEKELEYVDKCDYTLTNYQWEIEKMYLNLISIIDQILSPIQN